MPNQIKQEEAKQRMKILDFKTVSPLFEMERDGVKPFIIRLIEKGDGHQRALCQWQPHYDWGARITNPNTGENFVRKVVAVSFLQYFDLREDDSWRRHARFCDWRVIVLGSLIAG